MDVTGRSAAAISAIFVRIWHRNFTADYKQSVVEGPPCRQVSSRASSPFLKRVSLTTTELPDTKAGQLDITVQRDALQVTKSYLLYPGSSIVREWVTFKNAGAVPLPISDACFLNLTVQPGAGPSPDFSWMSGGENNPGSWNLKTQSLNPGKPRKFDSYEPFPAEMLGGQQFPGDGIDARVLLNGQQVWPATNWQFVANATGTPFVGPDNAHPDMGQDVARVWTTPKAGRVHAEPTRPVCRALE